MVRKAILPKQCNWLPTRNRKENESAFWGGCVAHFAELCGTHISFLLFPCFFSLFHRLSEFSIAQNRWSVKLLRFFITSFVYYRINFQNSQWNRALHGKILALLRWIKATKKIFLWFVLRIRTQTDFSEIFGVAECEIMCLRTLWNIALSSQCEMKQIPLTRRNAFHTRSVFHARSAFHKSRKGFISLKKAKSFDLDFLCCHYKTDPYKTIVQKQSVFFAVRVDLSLGIDGSWQ